VAIKNGQVRETGNILYTRQIKTKAQNNLYCTPINTNKTRALLQTTGGGDEIEHPK